MASAPIDYYAQMANIPDPGKKFEEGMAWAQQQKELEKAKARQAKMEADYTALTAGPMTAVKLRDFTLKYPEVGDKFKGAIDALSADEKKAAVQQFLPAATALYSGNATVAEQQLRTISDAYKNSGNVQMAKLYGDAAESIKISPDQANVVLSMMANAIDPEWAGKVDASRKTDSEINTAKQKAVKLAENAGIEPFQVKYWTNGVTMVIGKNNEQMVRDASGKVLTGADADAAVRSGMNADVILAGGKAGAAAAAEASVRAETGPGIVASEQAAKDAVAIGTEAFKKIAPIKRNISNYDEAIRLIENEGANTGIIASRLPSLFASSIELDNLGQTMGVESLQGGGFGTLSDSDVRLSIQRALPKGLEGPELVAWLKRKKAADLKYVSELERAAKFMQKGRTLADFLEANGNMVPPSAAPAANAPPANLLREGTVTTFKNGQQWTLRGGQPVQVK